jgi:peptidoglycan hydrolase CwlO-like protein
MKWKTLIVIIATLTSLLSFRTQVYAVECTDSDPPDNYSSDDAKKYWQDVEAACQAKIASSLNQQSTLKQAITTLNSKIIYAAAQIKQTKSQIKQTEEEIVGLSQVIDDLSGSQQELDQVYKAKVRKFYKNREPQTIALFLSSDSFANFYTNIKYLQTVRLRDKVVLQEIEKYRQNFDQRKQVKENKQEELTLLQSRLLTQNIELKNQQDQKNILLEQTKNDEKTYQQLKAQAQEQIAAFNTYVVNQGGSDILSGTTKEDPGWGTYYNQRDEQWGNRALGSSNISVADAGCLITSMAMVMSHYGKSVTPGSIAAQSELFSFADFRLGSLTISGIGTNRTRIAYSKSTAQSVLDNELSSNSGKPVIVGIIQYGSSRPEHFVVIKQKVDGDYLMNDPFLSDGYNTKFSAHYPLSSIATVDRITVN